MITTDRDTFSEGYHAGARWALEDIRAWTPAHETLAMLREESQSSQRWARAYYLGALRGYREATRTLQHGRWGT